MGSSLHWDQHAMTAGYHFLAAAHAQGQLERDVRDSEERQVRDLQAQRGVLALAERFLILHASKLVALMMFWAAMAQPGAIGGLLLGKEPPDGASDVRQLPSV